MRIINFFLHYSRNTVVCSLLAATVSGICNAALLALINKLLKSNGTLSFSLLLEFASLCVMLPLSRYVSEILLNDLGQDSLYSLRMQISRQVLAAPLRYLEEIGVHRVLAVLTEDVPVITSAILLVPLLCLNITVILGCLVYIGLLSWKLLCIVGLFILFGITGYQLPVLKAQGIFKQARADGDLLLKHFQSMFSGIKELKLHSERRSSFFTSILDPTAFSLKKHNKRAMRIYTASSAWGQTLVFFVIGFVLVSFSGQANHATLTGCTLAIVYIMAPLQIVMNMAPNLARAAVALKNVEEMGFRLSAQQESTLDNIATWGLSRDWRLEFKAVTHFYSRDGEAHNFVLGPMDIVFRAGDLVFIVGGNGSGKTTFAKLLTGLYTPQSGEICIDGASATSTPLEREQYRQNFSAIFSDFFVFDRLLGLDGSRIDGAAAEYLDKLNLTHKLRIEHGHLSAVDLSQGQRKRLALLAAYMEDRPVYLFDEWAADQDPSFKEIFYLELLPDLRTRGKTVFVISHDDRYYHVADRIIKFDDGLIIADVTQGSTRPGHVSLT